MTASVKAVKERVRATVDAVAATDLEGDDGSSSSRFIRGLALGALVGAAIAGSTIWQRRRVRRRIREQLQDEGDTPEA
jgi:hypothetical protein